MPPRKVGAKTQQVAAPKPLSTSKLVKKEIAIIETLHKAENHQLNSFIKTRTSELDKDISALRQKLKLSGSLTTKNDELVSKTAGLNLSVSGLGLGRVNLDTETISHGQGNARIRSERSQPTFKLDPTKTKQQPQHTTTKDHLVILLARIKLKMEDVNMDPEELRELLLPRDMVADGEYFIPIGELTGVLQTDLLMPVTQPDQMLMLRQYGNQYGEVDVKALLSDAGVWCENDSLFSARYGDHSPDQSPAKRHDHDSFYSADKPVERNRAPPPASPPRNSLSPVQESSPDHSPVHKSRHTAVHSERDDDDDFDALIRRGPGAGDGLSLSSQAPSAHPVRSHKSDRTSAKHRDLLSQSARNIDELGELHDLIAEETDQRLLDRQRAADEGDEEDRMADALLHGRNTRKHEAESNSRPPVVPPRRLNAAEDERDRSLVEEDEFDSEALELDRKFNPYRDSKKPKESVVRESSADDQRRVATLELENKRLKKEISAFDSEFFEQLEDLKYRYSQLQEIVGESPGIPATQPSLLSTHTSSPDYLTNVSKGKGALPLDTLSWSVRNSMTAMDRAGLTSPLVNRPRPAHAYTYAPGSHNKYTEQQQSSGRSLGGTNAFTSRGRRSYEDDEQPSGTRGDDLLYGSSPVRHTASMALRHSSGRTLSGGQFGIGTGTHSVIASTDFGVRDTMRSLDSAGGIAGAAAESFSNLCERRLAFELSNHPTPEQATNALIHRVVDVATRKGGAGFITCPQLSDVIASVGLTMAPREVEVLATGFASDGKGGVDAKEFCEVVQSMLYNLLGQHAAKVAESRAMVNGLETERRGNDEFERLLLELCEGILLHDKRAVIGTSTNLFKTLVRPFEEEDARNTGAVDFETFCGVLKDMGSLLSRQDLAVLAERFIREEPGSEPADLDDVTAFRRTKLSGSLKGAAKTRTSFGDWLSSSGVDLDIPEGRMGGMVQYEPFVRRMEEILEGLMERSGGVAVGASKYPWILREYEFVDTLISQLEAMQPSQRRRVLMALQYALSAADPKQECDVDGFTVLNALLSAGFKLQRVNRVRLLRAVEEMGGKIDYRELCQVLLNSCADWTHEEKHVVKKILQAMGVTVVDRRTWLARLRHLLVDSSSKLAKKTGEWMTGGTGEAGIPPATFLHCLRDCGVSLNVEEEATLLDCLDTERLSRLGQVEVDASRPLVAKRDNWSIPLIEYDSFLNFCARHCGSWVDAAPEVNSFLQETLKTIANPVLAVHEFASLIHAFDENSSGSVSERAFQICCHRSRLLANLNDEDILTLSDILAVDGGGTVNYTAFIVHLRTLTSALTNAHSSGPNIIEQLIKNATDNQGTLLPLRNWLIRHTDLETFLLTAKDMNSLLREFSVVYRPDDLEALQMDIGRHVDSSNTSKARSSKRNGMEFDDHTLKHAATGRHGSSTKKHVIDTRDLLSQVIKQRSHWTRLHPHLCKKILRGLQQAGAELFANSHITATAHNKAGSAADGSKGLETAVVRRILSRLRAFSGEASHIDSDGDGDAQQHNSGMVEKDIFAQLTRVSGLSLSDEDILVLADATDTLPEASRVRHDVLLEVFAGSRRGAAEEDDLHGGHAGGGDSSFTEANEFALNHLRSLLWTSAARLHRTTVEWVADVRTVVAGFDASKSGFIAVEDLVVALSLLNASVSPDLLRDIPFVPQGPGLVNYGELLRHVLVPPTTAKGKTGAMDGTTTAGNKSPSKGGSRTEGGKVRLTLQKKAVEKESPVRSLLNVVRRSIHSFIVSDSSLEEAWVCLLRVFQRFDPTESNQISPRDFCLAISVLVDGDDVVLTKSEWAEIIDHFKAPSGPSSSQQGSGRGGAQSFYDSTSVDYMLFCETVLDPTEIQTRQQSEAKRGLSASSKGLRGDALSNTDRAKQHLSTSTSSYQSSKERLNNRAKDTAGTAGSVAASANNSALNQLSRGESAGSSEAKSSGGNHFRRDSSRGGNAHSAGAFDGTISGAPIASSRTNQASTYSSKSNHAYGQPSDRTAGKRPVLDKENRDIVSRFETASQNRAMARSDADKHPSDSRHSGSASALSAAHRKAVDSKHSRPNSSQFGTDSLYRVARTQGQASRDVARGHSKNTADNYALRNTTRGVSGRGNRDWDE